MLELDKFAIRVLVTLLVYLCHAVICNEPTQIDANPLSSQVHCSASSIYLSSRIAKRIRRDLTNNFHDIAVKSSNGKKKKKLFCRLIQVH